MLRVVSVSWKGCSRRAAIRFEKPFLRFEKALYRQCAGQGSIARLHQERETYTRHGGFTEHAHWDMAFPSGVFKLPLGKEWSRTFFNLRVTIMQPFTVMMFS